MADAPPTVLSRRLTPRAEPVGSLLRPPWLKDAYGRIYGRHASHAANVLNSAEREEIRRLDRRVDEAIAAAVVRQIDAGLDVVTDGELRRAHYVNSFFDAVSGITENFASEFFDGEVAPPPEPIANERLQLVENPLVREYSFVASLSAHPAKVTIQTPSSFFFPSALYSPAAYRSRGEFVEHVTELVGQLLQEAVEAGARYVQFDYPLYPALADPDKREQLLDHLGEDADTVLSRAIAADNAALARLPPDVTTALHICRGNFRSRWWARGSLEPVGERMFSELRFDRLLVEWEDTDREGDYSALRFLPKDGPTVVLGLVSSKVAEMETDEEIVRRLDQASRFASIDQLALSPQCGFASVWMGNEVSEDVQWRKLELVGRVADQVWGRQSDGPDQPSAQTRSATRATTSSLRH